MGVSIVPDLFQDCICQFFEDLEAVKAYMDDLLVVMWGMYEQHLEELDTIMKQLSQAGLKRKIEKKYLLCQPYVEYVGYMITNEGIVDMQLPSTKMEMHHFLGMVQQYYHNLWSRCSKICATLTALT